MKRFFWVALFSLLLIVGCSGYEYEVQEIMPANHEEILQEINNVNTEQMDLQPNDARYSWSEDGMREIKEMSKQLLPTIQILGILQSDFPKENIAVTHEEFQLLLPTGVKHPENKMALVLPDNNQVIAVKGDKEAVNEILAWMESQKP